MGRTVALVTDLIQNNCTREVKSRMGTDLNYSIRILDIHVSRLNFMENHKVKAYAIEMPEDGLKPGDTFNIRVKAIFDDESNEIMYLDPMHYTVDTTNKKVLTVENGMLKVNGRGKTDIMVKISKDFIYDTQKGGRVIKHTVKIN